MTVLKWLKARTQKIEHKIKKKNPNENKSSYMQQKIKLATDRVFDGTTPRQTNKQKVKQTIQHPALSHDDIFLRYQRHYQELNRI